MKKGKILGVLTMTAVLLTGCADAMPKLTQEESEMIAEYAAGLLLKYSSNYNYRLVDEDVIVAAIQAAELEQALLEANMQEQSSEEESTEAEGMEASGQETESSEPQPEEPVTVVEEDLDADLAQVLGIEGISIQYQSYGLYDSYPETGNGFSVDAAQGKKLLVVRFDIENAVGEEIYCDLFDYSLRIRFHINGVAKSALTTMLPNDIGSYMETIPAGETREIVAVAEIDGISEEEIEALEMQISDSLGSCTLQLR